MTLPSVTLSRDDLQRLNSLLQESLYKMSLEITVLSKGIERSYSGLAELIEDGSVSRIIQTYELRIHARGGKARISANSEERDSHDLFIEGYSEWTTFVSELLSKFFEDNKNPIRTFFGGRVKMAPITLTSSIIAGHFFITISPLDLFDPATRTLPRLTFIYFITATVFLFSSFRHTLFPYAYWDLRSEQLPDRYVKSSLEVVGLVLLTLALLPLLEMIFS
jgi:hypothetical protein